MKLITSATKPVMETSQHKKKIMQTVSNSHNNIETIANFWHSTGDKYDTWKQQNKNKLFIKYL